MLKMVGVFLASLGPFFPAQSQDESFYRELIQDGKDKTQQSPFSDSFKINVSSRPYRFDWDQDGRAEDLIVEKRDQKDVLSFRSTRGDELASFTFLPLGTKSGIKKLSIHQLSSDSPMLIVYYDEGKSQRFDFEATARLYFITIPNGKWSQASLFKGPAFFHEKKYGKESYWLRTYQVLVKDFNQDQVNEISVRFRQSSHIYFYSFKKNTWGKL